MKMNLLQKIAALFMAFLLIFWFVLALTDTREGFYNYLYSFLFGFTPFFGGIFAMVGSRTWGGLKTALGKAVFFIGLGVFLWGSGEMIWSYYNFVLHEPAPYPSWADLGFAPSIFFYGLGAFYLSKLTGAQFGLRNKTAKFFAVIAPFVILPIAYYLLVTIARGGVLVPEGHTALKTILDLVYPFGGFVALTICIIVSGLSFQYMGGRYKADMVAILIGLAVMFMGDMAFSYATTVETYYNGNAGDLLLTSGTFLLTYGALGFYKLKEP